MYKIYILNFETWMEKFTNIIASAGADTWFKITFQSRIKKFKKIIRQKALKVYGYPSLHIPVQM